MKNLFILLLLIPMVLSGEEIHLECIYYVNYDSFGNMGIDKDKEIKRQRDFYGYISEDTGTKHKIILDKKKMKVNLRGDITSCQLSTDGDSYICSKKSYSEHSKFGGEFWSEHILNRRNLNYQYNWSIKKRPNGEKDSIVYNYGKCERQQDIQF